MERSSNSSQDREITDLYNKYDTLSKVVENIRDNHLAHIYQDLTTTKTNTEWLMKTYWIIATASIGGLIAGLINLVK